MQNILPMASRFHDGRPFSGVFGSFGVVRSLSISFVGISGPGSLRIGELLPALALPMAFLTIPQSIGFTCSSWFVFPFMLCRQQRFSTLALWYHEKNSVRKPVENRTQKICRFNGELKCTQYTGETKREKTQNSIQKIIIILCETLYIVCAQWTLLYKSIRTNRSTDNTSMLSYEPLN